MPDTCLRAPYWTLHWKTGLLYAMSADWRKLPPIPLPPP